MGMSHFHYKDGKIVDDWTVYDELSLLMQIKLGQLLDKQITKCRQRIVCMCCRLHATARQIHMLQ